MLSFEEIAPSWKRLSGTLNEFLRAIQGEPYQLICNIMLAFALSRFQVVVLSAYKQICAQSTNVLSDIDEDNFDRALGFLRPGVLVSHL